MQAAAEAKEQRSPGKSAPDQDQRHVNPGYSSGGSSDLDSWEKAKLGDINEEFVSINGESMHSDILTSLKQEIDKNKGLTTKVVRLEVSRLVDIESTFRTQSNHSRLRVSIVIDCLFQDPFDTPIEIVYEGVHDGPILGEGISGVVREIAHRATGVHYAMKCLPYSRMTSGPEGLEQLSNEIFIMCQLDLPYIVRIEEVYASSDEMYIVQELCSGGELFDRLEEQPDFHYTEAHCAKLVKQMATAVRYLHNKGIVHRDLKLEASFRCKNVLLFAGLRRGFRVLAS